MCVCTINSEVVNLILQIKNIKITYVLYNNKTQRSYDVIDALFLRLQGARKIQNVFASETDKN